MKMKITGMMFLFAVSKTAFAEKSISLAELSKHNSESDCWLAIDGYVYDMSKYIKLHNEECKRTKFVDYCGKDVSDAWKKKEAENKPHKKKSHRKLESSKVGRLLAN